jgi:hypothetical protein
MGHYIAMLRDFILSASLPWGLLLAPLRWLLRMLLGRKMIAVYRDRETLRRVHPDRWLFARPKDAIYGLWLSGEGVLRDLKPGEHGIKKLIFPDPETQLQSLTEFEGTTGQTYRLPETIGDMTKRAQGLGIKVRWYGGFTGVAMTFGNPTSSCKRWLHIEPILPHGDPGSRPHFRIDRWTSKKAYEAYWTTFKELWRASRKPPPASDDG